MSTERARAAGNVHTLDAVHTCQEPIVLHLTNIAVVVLVPTLALLLPSDAGAQGPPPSQLQVPAPVDAGAPGSAARRQAILPAFPALGAPPPKSPEPTPLREAGDGSGDLLYDTAGFSARIARDGSVTFKEHRFRLLGPRELWLPRAGPRNIPSLQESLTALARGRRVPGVNPNAQTIPYAHTDDSDLILPYVSRYRPDPMELCRTCATPRPAQWLTVAGRFDLTEDLMRFSGQDPYRYGKAKFLAATREMRIERAVKHHAANVRRAAAELPAMLESIACDAGRSRGERQAIIEALRDELDGETPEALTAVHRIEGFLAARFAAPVADDGCGRRAGQPQR